MYQVKELADLAGVSARTLRYYDSIGLLKPACVSEAGYRLYGEREVDLLQQILFYRERGMDLKEIRDILYTENFDILGALREHLRELEAQEDEFMEAVLIGKVLGKYSLGISDGLIALRIEQFIKEGKLEVITHAKPQDPSYHRMLRKRCSNFEK